MKQIAVATVNLRPACFHGDVARFCILQAIFSRLQSREDCLQYAESRDIPVEGSRTKIHSRDRNLLHVSHEGGELEDANQPPLESTWLLTKSPQEAPDRTEEVEIG